MTSTRQNVQRTVSSRLKAWAIKSISSLLSPIADRNTNSWIKHSRKRQLKNHKLSRQFNFFFFQRRGAVHFLKQFLVLHKRRDENKHLYSMIQPSGDYCINHVWHCCHSTFPLQTVYLRTKRAAAGRKPGWSPRFHVVRHLCTRQNLAIAVQPRSTAKRRGRGVTRRWGKDCVERSKSTCPKPRPLNHKDFGSWHLSMIR